MTQLQTASGDGWATAAGDPIGTAEVMAEWGEAVQFPSAGTVYDDTTVEHGGWYRYRVANADGTERWTGWVQAQAVGQVAVTGSWVEQDDGIAAAGRHVPPAYPGTATWTEADDGISGVGTYTLPEGVSAGTWVEDDDGIAAAGSRTVPEWAGTGSWVEQDDGIAAAGRMPTGLDLLVWLPTSVYRLPDLTTTFSLPGTATVDVPDLTTTADVPELEAAEQVPDLTGQVPVPELTTPLDVPVLTTVVNIVDQ